MLSRTITRALRRAGLAVAVAGAFAAVPAFAQGQPAAGTSAGTAHFTTADLARLCGPAADDANAMASRGACYGVLVAVGQMHAMYTHGRRGARPAFCMPDPTPTLDRVSADFVSWAAANQQYAGVRAAEGVLRFGAATYPCQRPASARRR